MTGVGLLGAFLGGLLALVSPCSALLLPSFFAYAFDRLGALVARTLAFYLGLAAVLVPLGAGVGALGALLTRYRGIATTIGGLVVVALGVATMLGLGFGVATAQRATARIRVSSFASVVALGAVYGLAGFCAGPLLGSVLTVSAVGGDPFYGGLLMGVYALGMAAPLFVLAVVWERFGLGRRRWLRGRELRWGPVRTHTTSLVSGALFVAIGLLFLLTEGTANLGGFVGVDEQYDLQLWLGRAARAVSDAAVLLVAVLAAIGLLVLRLVRRRHAERVESREGEPR
ncbi:cytochrome c biogenesis CcdA family protein [Actinophytocola sp. NPDC049390]|uniref:cytochrome c biogenesis CcdA family protein n=1 Tax=Actinophytocola sp. NPDC049390 TaxID=3363894 RepID=UPI0037A7C58D